MSFFRSLFKNEESKEESPVSSVNEAALESPAVAVQAAEDLELIAVISAAVAAMSEGRAVIKSISPVMPVMPVRGAASAWKTAARLENHRGLY